MDLPKIDFMGIVSLNTKGFNRFAFFMPHPRTSSCAADLTVFWN
jgi:hypothetical protein